MHYSCCQHDIHLFGLVVANNWFGVSLKFSGIGLSTISLGFIFIFTASSKNVLAHQYECFYLGVTNNLHIRFYNLTEKICMYKYWSYLNQTACIVHSLTFSFQSDKNAAIVSASWQINILQYFIWLHVRNKSGIWSRKL